MQTHVQIKSLILMQTGTYNAQFIRPYVSQLNGTTLNDLVNRASSNPAEAMSSSLFNSYATPALAPSATVDAAVSIPNGWSEKRYMFLLEVDVHQGGLNSGCSSTYYFQGYTTHMGITHAQTLDPEMAFYVNSFIQMNNGFQKLANGMTTPRRVFARSVQVINGRLVQEALNNGAYYTMRPEDLYHGMQSSALGTGGFHDGHRVQVRDYRLLGASEQRSTHRYNNNPGEYLSNMARSYTMASSLSEFGQGARDIYGQAIGAVEPIHLQENPFFRALSALYNIGVGGQGAWEGRTSFTLSELGKFDPQILQKTAVHALGQIGQACVHTAGQTSNWHGSNIETTTASYLVNNVPGLMTRYGLTNITFAATNHDSTGQAVVQLLDGRSLMTGDLNPVYQMFQTRLVNEVLNHISYGNQIAYAITMQVDLMMETRLTVDMGGGAIDYVCPTFCDSMLNPLLTTNSNNFAMITHDVETFLNNIGTEVHHGHAASYLNSEI